MGIKAKIDKGQPTKVAKKTSKRQTKKSAKSDVYAFIERDGDKIFLKPEVVEKFDEFESDFKNIQNEQMLFELKKENISLQVENKNKEIKLLERDKRDVETAIFHKKTELKQKKQLLGEYRTKITRELGNTVTSFGFDPDTLEIKDVKKLE